MNIDELLAEPLDLDDHTQKILNKLPPRQKQCFILHYAYGYKYKEIAVKMNVSMSAVRYNIFIANKKVSNLYKTP